MIDIDRDGRADWLYGDRSGIHFNLADGRRGFIESSRPLPCGTPDRAERLCLPIDIDGDGRIDLVTQWGHYAAPEGLSPIFRNEGGGKFLDVTAAMGLPRNRGAAGAKIRLYAPGTKRLLWCEQVAIYDSQASASYYAFAQTERHFGLGKRTAADVSVEFYPSGTVVRRPGAAANGTVVIRDGPSSRRTPANPPRHQRWHRLWLRYRRGKRPQT